VGVTEKKEKETRDGKPRGEKGGGGQEQSGGGGAVVNCVRCGGCVRWRGLGGGGWVGGKRRAQKAKRVRRNRAATGAGGGGRARERGRHAADRAAAKHLDGPACEGPRPSWSLAAGYETIGILVADPAVAMLVLQAWPSSAITLARRPIRRQFAGLRRGILHVMEFRERDDGQIVLACCLA